jgi:GDP-4-dehydro-6-deoxy-D-mannose reductase
MSDPNCILVTGATGFVGRHLLPALRREFPKAKLIAGFQAIQRLSLLENADDVLPLELLDPRSIHDCIRKARPDVVIHLAAEAAVSGSFDDPMRTWRSNVDGTLSLALEVMNASPETLLIFVSSADAYGLTFQSGLRLTEDAPFAPSNPYAASKAAADIALGEMALRGLRVIRMRPTNHTGSGQSDQFVVPAFARQLALIEAGRQEPVLRVGALDRWRDFLDVGDVCSAYVAAVRRAPHAPAGTAINIASGTSRRIGDILDALIARVGIEVEIQTEPARLRPTDILRADCDVTRAGEQIQWAPRIDWLTTLDTVLADWRNRIG